MARVDHPRGDRYVGDLRQGRPRRAAACAADRGSLPPGQTRQPDGRGSRRRTTWDSRGRRGRKADPEWLNRRRLLRGAERLTEDQRARLIAALDAADPNGDILAAWIAKELLRDVLACTATGGLRYDLAAALYRFYAFCAATSVPEIHDLAETIETWQAPMILAIITGLSNARSEGYNRIVKHVGRIAFGFRNPNNQRRRVRWACTRQSRQAPLRTRQLRPC